ncbi:MAG: SpoIID/LytB domain-containing protein [Cyanobacteriota bacterium]
MRLEDYLFALVPGKMPDNWPVAALQAQAILALAIPYLQPSLRTKLTRGLQAVVGFNIGILLFGHQTTIRTQQPHHSVKILRRQPNR